MGSGSRRDEQQRQHPQQVLPTGSPFPSQREAHVPKTNSDGDAAWQDISTVSYPNL